MFTSAAPTRQRSPTDNDDDDMPAPSPKAPRPRSRTRNRIEDAARLQRSTRPMSDNTTPSVTHTDPVVIPPSRASRKTSNLTTTPRKPTRRRPATTHPSLSRNGVPTSVSTILEVTSIPRPQKKGPHKNPQRLPSGNNVEDFSKLLLEGLETSDVDGSITDASASHSLDILLSPPGEDDDGKSALDSDLSPQTGLSVRSSSADSLPSLVNDTGSYALTPSNDIPTPPRFTHRGFSEKKYRLFSPSEECTLDHPLLPETPLISEEHSNLSLESDETDSTNRGRSLPKLGLTFKSNLTASLRAIKSAAQTVSNFANPSVQSEDFLTRSLFSFSPELTDDRRPIPTNLPASPALRRYLNPIPTSPAEIHIYQEYPTDPFNKIRSCPASIQMETYHHSEHDRSTKKTASGADESLPIPRQREPRENCDFLRMVVLEMNMRRRGKLRDDIPTRVKVYLPPRKGGSSKTLSTSSRSCRNESDKTTPQRWVGVSVECI